MFLAISILNMMATIRLTKGINPRTIHQSGFPAIPSKRITM